MKFCLLDLAYPCSHELTEEAMVICTERSQKGQSVFQKALDSVGYKIRRERENMNGVKGSGVHWGCLKGVRESRWEEI